MFHPSIRQSAPSLSHITWITASRNFRTISAVSDQKYFRQLQNHLFKYVFRLKCRRSWGAFNDLHQKEEILHEFWYFRRQLRETFFSLSSEFTRHHSCAKRHSFPIFIRQFFSLWNQGWHCWVAWIYSNNLCFLQKTIEFIFSLVFPSDLASSWFDDVKMIQLCSHHEQFC